MTETAYWYVLPSRTVMNAWARSNDDGNPDHDDTLINPVPMEALADVREVRNLRYDYGTQHRPVETDADWEGVRLRVALPGFAPDYFEAVGQHMYLSARAREVAALPEDAVTYIRLEIDPMTTPEARAQDYRLMRIRWNNLHAADPERSTLWTVMQVPPPEGPLWQKVVFREDFVPPADIFRIQGFSMDVVTETFAARWMDAGLTGMVFRDPYVPPRDPITGRYHERFRQPDGTAAEGWPE